MFNLKNKNETINLPSLYLLSRAWLFQEAKRKLEVGACDLTNHGARIFLLSAVTGLPSHSVLAHEDGVQNNCSDAGQRIACCECDRSEKQNFDKLLWTEG